MIVISDTTPLITLMKIGHLNLLNKLFGEIHIPSAVYEELTSNPRYNTEATEKKIVLLSISKQSLKIILPSSAFAKQQG